MLTILENDRLFVRDLPKYTVVTASAGSGKTRALKQRFVQLLLSSSIPNNSLRNVLAITFTNNAAREMKQRVLDALKSMSLGKEETLTEFQSLLSLTPSELSLEAGRLVDEILDNYSDFQIQTIDSFLARVFKASALELGLPPDLDIVLDSDAILDEAFSLFALDLSEGTSSANLLDKLIALLLENRGADDRFLWNPYSDLAAKVKELYRKIILTSKPLKHEDFSADINEFGAQLIRSVTELDAAVNKPGLVRSKRFEDYVEYARLQDVDGLLGHKFPSPPITKTGSDPGAYQRALHRLQPAFDKTGKLRERLLLLKARQHYQPYAEAHQLLARSIEAVKRERGQVDIGDIVKKLAEYLKPGIVPEIYYSLGETLCHYLIDEFQDTNPIQWETLEPLVGNALSMKGSLFVVGDMKQSIYGFRGADWRIMKHLRSAEVFPSATKDLKSLDTNFRSFEKILRFNDDVFKKAVPGKVINGAAEASGLATDEQRVRDIFQGKGVVEVTSVPADTAPEDPDQSQQKQRLLSIVDDCLVRGYRCSDITILSPRNDDIIEVSGWLNERGISFISHSSLDVRSRKVTGELLALLQFLDSPIDDLSFATFLLSDTFAALLQRAGTRLPRQRILDFLFAQRLAHQRGRPLYIFFRQAYPELWQNYFEDLFNIVGYLPVYDLISETYKILGVFSLLPEEEATLVKILEVVKDFEEKGENSLKGFLRYAGESSEDADWDIDIPTDVNAIRAMTIHKAKGLESKVVIVLLYDSQHRRDSLYLQNEGDEVRLVRLTKGNSDEVEELKELYHEKELGHTVDDLNKLYVAFTRAEEEMYVISVKARRGKTPSEFLPEGGYDESPAQKPKVPRSQEQTENRVQLCHDLPRAAIRPTEYAGIAVHETQRGEFFHAVLETIEYVDENLGSHLEEAIRRAQVRTGFTAESPQIRDELTAVLQQAAIGRYFEKKIGRTILNEQEFTDPDGRLVRMDRVVVDTEVVTVIDYKTGDEKPDYAEQVTRYLKILKDVYRGHALQGFLVFIDRKRILPVL